jgi:hypothetical protein
MKLYNSVYTNIINGPKYIELHKKTKHMDNKGNINLNEIENHTHFTQNETQPYKKFMGELSIVLTDYVSKTVDNEKVLNDFDKILEDLNTNQRFIKKIFAEKKTSEDIDISTLNPKFVLVFKGGNTYKMYNEVIKKSLGNSIMGESSFFSKSDADFSLKIMIENGGKKEFIAFDADGDDFKNIISTVFYLILNKFKNMFTKNNCEYMEICRNNDNIMRRHMKDMKKQCLDRILKSRAEFESKLMNKMIKLNYVKIDAQQIKIVENNYTEEKLIESYTKSENKTLIEILNADKDGSKGLQNIDDIINEYKLFIAIAFRDYNKLPEASKNGNIDKNIVIEIQGLKTESYWRDVKTLYDVRDITHICIGDVNYTVSDDVNDMKTNDELYNLLISKLNKDINEERDSMDVPIERMKNMGRISSNRNDYAMETIENYAGKLTTTTMDIYPIHMEQRFKTPFFISINKRIKKILPKISGPTRQTDLLRNLYRFRYNIDGKEHNERKDYETSFDKSFEELQKHVTYAKPNSSDHLKGLLLTDIVLGRLMVNIGLVFKLKDKSYTTLSVPAEFIDITYAYKGTLKSKMNEKHEDYILLNAFENNKHLQDMKKIVDLYNQKKENVNDAEVLGLNVNDVKDVKTFKSVIDTYNATNMGKELAKYVDHKYIYFPKMHTEILDLYAIFLLEFKSINSAHKFEKRLNRFLLLSVIEQMSTNDYATVLNNQLSFMGYTCKNNNKIVNILNDLIKKNNIKNTDVPNNKFKLLHDIRQEIIDDDSFAIDINDTTRIKSMCGIDRFLYNYHMLDDNDNLHGLPPNNLVEDECKNTTRKMFILKINEYYFVITLNEKLRKINKNENNVAKNENYAASIATAIKEIYKICNGNNTTNDIKNEIDKNKIINEFKQLDAENENNNVALCDNSNEIDFYKKIEIIRERLLMIVIDQMIQIYTRQGNNTTMINNPINMFASLYKGSINKMLDQ